MTDIQTLKSLIETLLFVSEKPLKLGTMLQAILQWRRSRVLEPQEPDESESSALRSELQLALEALRQDYAERGIRLAEVAQGWQWVTPVEHSALVETLHEAKPMRLSKPALETLAIVAYRQPVTRAEIESIRGMDCGAVLKTLLEKQLLRTLGKKDEPGKPTLYGTSAFFLEQFQLKNLQELPSLKDYAELEGELKSRAEDLGLKVALQPGEDWLGALDIAPLGAPVDTEALMSEVEKSLAELGALDKPA